MQSQKMPVTDSAGSIGSPVRLAEITSGHLMRLFDSLVNRSLQALVRVGAITDFAPALPHFDIRAWTALNVLFDAHSHRGMPHLAGLRAIEESVTDPLNRCEVKAARTVARVRLMGDAGARTLVFWTLATVAEEHAAEGLAPRCGRPIRRYQDHGRIDFDSALLVDRSEVRQLKPTDAIHEECCHAYSNPP